MKEEGEDEQRLDGRYIKGEMAKAALGFGIGEMKER